LNDRIAEDESLRFPIARAHAFRKIEKHHLDARKRPGISGFTSAESSLNANERKNRDDGADQNEGASFINRRFFHRSPLPSFECYRSVRD